MAPRTTAKGKRGRPRTKRTATATPSGSPPPSIDIKSSADVGKALSIMRKHPLTIILVFASWCPHCHTFMERWNKYKALPNRTSPMIAVEQQQSEEFLKNVKGKDGRPVSINAFPTVLASTSRSNSGTATEDPTNVGAAINTDEESMNTVLTEGSATLTEGSSSSSNSEPEDLTNSNFNNLNETNSASNASDFSVSNSPENNRSDSGSGSGSGFRNSNELSAEVLKAVKSASNRMRGSNSGRRRPVTRKRVANRSATPFAEPPRGEFSLISGGGCGNGSCGMPPVGQAGPSGLYKLTGGCMDVKKSLYSAMKSFRDLSRKSRKFVEQQFK
jgi:hypothetical protein